MHAHTHTHTQTLKHDALYTTGVDITADVDIRNANLYSLYDGFKLVKN